MSILLKGGTVVSAYNRRQLDIRIDGEQIVEMGANLPVENSQIEDVTGMNIKEKVFTFRINSMAQ